MCQILYSHSHSFPLSLGYWSARHMVSSIVCLVVLGSSSAVKAIQKHHYL